MLHLEVLLNVANSLCCPPHRAFLCWRVCVTSSASACSRPIRTVCFLGQLVSLWGFVRFTWVVPFACNSLYFWKATVMSLFISDFPYWSPFPFLLGRVSWRLVDFAGLPKEPACSSVGFSVFSAPPVCLPSHLGSFLPPAGCPFSFLSSFSSGYWRQKVRLLIWGLPFLTQELTATRFCELSSSCAAQVWGCVFIFMMYF